MLARPGKRLDLLSGAHDRTRCIEEIHADGHELADALVVVSSHDRDASDVLAPLPESCIDQLDPTGRRGNARWGHRDFLSGPFRSVRRFADGHTAPSQEEC